MNKTNQYFQEADEDFSELYAILEESLMTLDRALETKGYVRLCKNDREELQELKNSFNEALSLVDDHIRGDK
jgi:hypothetical protein